MSFNIDISKLGKTYMNNTNFNFNAALDKYKIKTMVGLESIYSISSTITFENNVSCLYSCNISGAYTFNNLTANNFNISGDILKVANISVKSTIYIQNSASINNISIYNTLLVTNTSILNNNVTVNTDLFILNACNILNYITSTNIIVNNTSIFNNITSTGNLNTLLNITCNNIMANNLSVINNSILYNTVTVISNLYTSNIISNIITSSSILTCNNLLINDSSSINTSLYVSNITTITGNINVSTTCNIINNVYTNSIVSNKLATSGNIICNLPEYIDNTTAAANGIPYKGLYRLGGIVKIRLNLESRIILLLGDAIINTYINNIFIDPLISISDNLDEILQPVITGTVITTILGTYNLSYYVINSFNNKSNIVYRTVNVINYPIISNILLASKIITFTLTGIYNTLIYKITKNNIIILPETQLLSNSIDTTSITLDLIPYNIILLLKDLNNFTIKTIIIGLTSIKLGPVLEISGFNPYNVNTKTSYNVLTNVKAYTLPSTALTVSTSIVDNLNNIKTLSSGILSIAYNTSYKITYSTTDSSSININYQIDVFVLDNTIPVITLIGPATIYTDKISTYIDQGYTVSDNSGQYKVTVMGYVNTSNLGTYYIIYTATDLSNNKNKVMRTIIVRDDIIALNPPIVTTIDQYSTWIDPGYILQSGFDPVVSISSESVNTNNTYTAIMEYTATDLYSSKTISRTVNVRKSVLRIIFYTWYEYRIFDWFNTMYTQLNKPFVDPGYTITDSSTMLSIVSTVNTSIAGVYKIVYTTIDANKISSIGTRYVVVSDSCLIPLTGPGEPVKYTAMGGGYICNNSDRIGDWPSGTSAIATFWLGFCGSNIISKFDSTFDHNGTWSIMMRLRFDPFWFFRIEFDNVFNDGGVPVGTQPLNTIYFYGTSYNAYIGAAYIGGPNVTTVYYTTFAIIAAAIRLGVYIVMNRVNNYIIVKIYNLTGSLLCDVTSKVPFVYTQKQQIFSIIVPDDSTAPISYRGTASLNGGVYYKKTELFPSDWDPIYLVSPKYNGNNALYLTV